MSIDARISDVLYPGDGTAVLDLVSRDGRSPPGQSRLTLENPPLNLPGSLDCLIGMDIWGNSSVIMVGGHKLFDRTGYTTVRFPEKD